MEQESQRLIFVASLILWHLTKTLHNFIEYCSLWDILVVLSLFLAVVIPDILACWACLHSTTFAMRIHNFRKPVGEVAENRINSL